MITDTEIAVTEYVRKCGIKATVQLQQIGKVRDDWKCDVWHVMINSEGFEFNTGTGHRVVRTGMTFDRMTTIEIKALRKLWGIDRSDHLVKPTGDQVLVGGRTVSCQREQYTKPPTLASVLHSLIMDADLAQSTFQDFCDDLGMDSDSIKDRRTYFACQAIHEQLRSLFSAQQLDDLRTLLEDY